MKKKVTVVFCSAAHRARFRKDVGSKAQYNISYKKKGCWVCDSMRAAGKL